MFFDVWELLDDFIQRGQKILMKYQGMLKKSYQEPFNKSNCS